ncbi:MAG: M16 family metallopeptidase [Bacteroidota bacterium]
MMNFSQNSQNNAYPNIFPNSMKKLGIFTAYLIIGAFVFTSIILGQAPDRSKPPELGPTPSLTLPAIQHLKLSNNLAVVLMEKHQVPLVQVELVVKTGSVMNPADKLGLANLTATMMMQGAGSRNALELADAIDFLGARIYTYGSWHVSGVSLHTPLSKLEDALALFADVALRPTFTSEELERQRKERLTRLGQMHDEPTGISTTAFSQIIFGKDHPYGQMGSGDEKSIRSVTTTDLQNFHQKYFHPNNATIIVVGDVTADKIIPLLEKVFGSWDKGDDIQQPVVPTAAQVASRTVYLIDKPGAAQSVIRIGRVGVERSNPDYFAIEVMNTILGGSFSSRLNHNLRETHGYTYGAGSGFTYPPFPGSFSARASVQTAVTDSSLIEFFKELHGILTPVSDDELTRAKNYLALQYPNGFQAVGQISSQLEDLVNYNLPDTYFNDYVKNVFAITKDDVNRVAKKYIDPERVAIVIVGDRSKIESGIKALNLGTIQNMTIDDVLGKAPVLEK